MDSRGLELSDIGTSERIYRFMAERLKETGDTLPCTMQAMCVYAAEPRADIDYLKFINLDNQSLLDACYITSFNTYPPDAFLVKWKDDIAALQKDEFHRKFMNAFIELPAYRNRHVRLRNCICITPNIKTNKVAKFRAGFGACFRKGLYRMLIPLFKRLPESWKVLLRKHFWKYFFVW